MLQTLVDPERRKYETSSEMSIEFEVDGPYKVGMARSGIPYTPELQVTTIRGTAFVASLSGWMGT